MTQDKRNKKLSLVDLQQQIGELTEALQRERADSDNIRRRHDDQISGLKNMVKASVIRDLLPVIDNFERALKHVPDTSSLIQPENVTQGPADQLPGKHEPDTMRETVIDESPRKQNFQTIIDYIKGVQALVKQFEDTLKQIGVERIKTVGEVFNPHLHEAVSMEGSSGGKEIVSEELQSGYVMGDEVIRHAMVKVRTTSEQEYAKRNKEKGE